MTGNAGARTPSSPPPAAPGRVDYTGAVYGSFLAASVVMGAGTLGSYPKIELILLLLSTGVVFWAAHVHSRLFGVWLVHEPVGWAQVRRIAAAEWPIVQAAVPPCVAVAVSPLLGLGLDGTEWLALAVAVAGQVGWAGAAAVRSGAPRGLVVVSGAVNLLLGLVLVVLKASLQH